MRFPFSRFQVHNLEVLEDGLHIGSSHVKDRRLLLWKLLPDYRGGAGGMNKMDTEGDTVCLLCVVVDLLQGDYVTGMETQRYGS